MKPDWSQLTTNGTLIEESMKFKNEIKNTACFKKKSSSAYVIAMLFDSGF